MGLSSLPSLNVATPVFFMGMNTLIENEGLDVWKSYLRWNVVQAAAPYLSSPFVDASFDFFGRTLLGQKENQARWKRCAVLTGTPFSGSGSLPSVLVGLSFPPIKIGLTGTNTPGLLQLVWK